MMRNDALFFQASDPRGTWTSSSLFSIIGNELCSDYLLYAVFGARGADQLAAKVAGPVDPVGAELSIGCREWRR
jgi:hypothetical protein